MNFKNYPLIENLSDLYRNDILSFLATSFYRNNDVWFSVTQNFY